MAYIKQALPAYGGMAQLVQQRPGKSSSRVKSTACGFKSRSFRQEASVNGKPAVSKTATPRSSRGASARKVGRDGLIH